MAKKKSLGRGFDAILFQSEDDKITSSTEDFFEKSAGKVVYIDLERVSPNAKQPRRDIDQDSIKELAQSIENYDLIQPITVHAIDAENFEIIAGERRWRAFKWLNRESIPCLIIDHSDDEKKRSILELALIENLQREDLNAIEIAISYQQLLETKYESITQLAKKLGKDRTNVSNHIRLLGLPPSIQTAIRDQKISMGHGRAILSLKDPSDQKILYENILDEALSVRQTEDWIKEIKAGVNTTKPQKLPKEKISQKYQEDLENMSGLFHTKVSMVSLKKGKGHIRIHFSSEEEFERIIDRIKQYES